MGRALTTLSRRLLVARTPLVTAASDAALSRTPIGSWHGHRAIDSEYALRPAGREDEGKWTVAAAGGEVDLRGQSAAGPSEGTVGWLVGRGLLAGVALIKQLS